MELTAQAFFGREEDHHDVHEQDAFDVTDAEPICVEALLLHAEATGGEHPEDALLAELARWLVARGASAAERRAAIELAREAIEHLGGLDGLPASWQTLPVERLRRASGASAACGCELVRWLGESGRLSLHGQRMLLRQLAAPGHATSDSRAHATLAQAQPGPKSQIAA